MRARAECADKRAFLYELPRIYIPRTPVNKGKKEGLTEREAKHVRLFDAEKPWSTLVRGACLVRPQTPVISPRRTWKHPLWESGGGGCSCSSCCMVP